MIVVQLTHLPPAELEPLLVESRAEGHGFVDRLVDAYSRGDNRFNRPGEALFGVYANRERSGRQLVAVGGLNRDPYLPDQNAGRVRHLYVLPAFRRRGAGRLLMEAIIDAARPHFPLLTLRTVNPDADLFYRALGFHAGADVPNASHFMRVTGV